MDGWEPYHGYREAHALNENWVRIECPRDGNRFLAPIGLAVFPAADGKGMPGAEVTCPECRTKFRVSVQILVERQLPEEREMIAADD